MAQQVNPRELAGFLSRLNSLSNQVVNCLQQQTPSHETLTGRESEWWDVDGTSVFSAIAFLHWDYYAWTQLSNGFCRQAGSGECLFCACDLCSRLRRSRSAASGGDSSTWFLHPLQRKRCIINDFI